jgi:hypothetical protein
MWGWNHQSRTYCSSWGMSSNSPMHLQPAGLPGRRRSPWTAGGRCPSLTRAQARAASGFLRGAGRRPNSCWECARPRPWGCRSLSAPRAAARQPAQAEGGSTGAALRPPAARPECQAIPMPARVHTVAAGVSTNQNAHKCCTTAARDLHKHPGASPESRTMSYGVLQRSRCPAACRGEQGRHGGLCMGASVSSSRTSALGSS